MFLIEDIIDRYVNLSESLNEEENPAYQRSNATADNLKKIWAAIDRQRALLQKELYSTNDKLDDLTQEKAHLFDVDAEIPLTIVNAGNAKLPASVLMINLTSALACPSFFLGQCFIKHGRCYAMQNENQYTGSRERGFKSDLMTTRLLALYEAGNKAPMRRYFNLVETYIQLGNAMAKNAYRSNLAKLERQLRRPATLAERQTIEILSNGLKISDIRLNERGDFPCQTSVNLWTKFAAKMKRKYNIDTHAYTARKLDFTRAKDAMAINPSHGGINVGDTPRQYRAITDEKYESLPGGNRTNGEGQPILGKINGTYFYKCPCTEGNPQCDICNVCFKQNQTGYPYTIFVRLHGAKNANGLKNLFAPSQMQKCMELSKREGWISQSELEDLPKVQDKLDDIEQIQSKARARLDEPPTKAKKSKSK